MRDPSQAELETALEFVSGPLNGEAADDVASAWRYGYGRLDVSAKRVEEFYPFEHFIDQRWGGKSLPDPVLGWTHLSATGGHPGQDAKHCAIRRWVSPIAGPIEVQGRLVHTADKGDGVRGWIISSRHGAIKEWTVKHGGHDTVVESLDVEPGEKIDFVVDCLKTSDFDSFNWAPIIRTKQVAGSATSVVQLWHSTNDFSGPAPARLNPWEQLAQALLVSNEFVFVD